MSWKWMDRLVGADPRIDLDHAVRSRIAVAFTVVFCLMGLVNAAVLAFLVDGRPGMAELAVGSALLAALVGGTGLKLRRPNLTMAMMLLLAALALSTAAVANRGSFPPASLYLPGIILGAYIAWGRRAVLGAILPVAAYFGYVLWEAGRAHDTLLAFSPPEMLHILVAASAFSCGWIVLFGTSFRSAARDAQTALEEYNAKLEEALAAAREANQAKSEFIANMSHEVRTPLNGVLGMTSVLLQDTRLSDEHKRSLKLIDTSGKSLLELLNDVLDLSKIEAGVLDLEPADFDLVALLRGVADHWRAQAGSKGLNLVFSHEAAGDRLDVHGDPVRVRQIVNNLVSNAVKFTPRGGITVALGKSVGEDGTIRVSINVRDTGVGIPRDKHETIFEAFTQVDTSTTRQYGGTGLGLAICRRLVRQMGGDITLSSEPGRGASFSCDIPFEAGRAAPEPAESAPVDPILVEDPLRILVVDDVATNQLVLRAMVQQVMTGGGLQVDCAASGREAVNKATAEAYDIVLMDIQMPEMDGVSAMRCIRETRNSGRARIVAVTALASDDHRRAFEADGFAGYLPKPVEMGTLRALLANLLAPDDDTASDDPAGQSAAGGER
ncbi:MAG: ATP-binding protein [Pseudomonadota bacterium]|nr:ATP-binding protein [Pseudomonadota bacterium]